MKALHSDKKCKSVKKKDASFQVVGGEELAGPEEKEVGAGPEKNVEEILGLFEGHGSAFL